MKIGIIGANGKAGNLILQEAIDRGHNVTAVVRNANKLKRNDIEVIEKTMFDLNAKDIENLDVIVNAFGAPVGEEQAHVDAGLKLIELIKETNIRAIIVGGAGSLFVGENQSIRLIETSDFPDEFKPTAKGQGRNLKDLQEASDIVWTFISPSADFDFEGARTGAYEIGKDNLLVNSKGESYISYADYAIAVIDEIEKPRHLNQRFTVVGERN